MHDSFNTYGDIHESVTYIPCIKQYDVVLLPLLRCWSLGAVILEISENTLYFLEFFLCDDKCNWSLTSGKEFKYLSIYTNDLVFQDNPFSIYLINSQCIISTITCAYQKLLQYSPIRNFINNFNIYQRQLHVAEWQLHAGIWNKPILLCFSLQNNHRSPLCFWWHIAFVCCDMKQDENINR